MPPKKKVASSTPIEAVEHHDKRVNIPTGQQAHLVDLQESLPGQLRYPRDPSLDPQLVWKGKDELDGNDLQVPTVPIYIQEKIDPRAIVENLRDTAGPGEPEPELTLFDNFDGLNELDPIEKIDFYQHEGNWQNRLILGDSLVVMASLAEKENLRGKVQMIYIDPPYGIKFGSNWQVSTRKRDVRDGKVEDASREPEVVKAFRDTWELGIHSYLSYLRDRLSVASDLLTETGSLFVQISEENVHLVRSLMDEILGPDNFVSQIVYRTSGGLGSARLTRTSDYVIWYAKDLAQMKFRRLFGTKRTGEDSPYSSLLLADGTQRRMTLREREGIEPLPQGARIFRLVSLLSSGSTPSCIYDYEFEGETYSPGGGRSWKTNQSGMERLEAAGRLVAGGKTMQYLYFFDDFPVMELNNVWTDTGGEPSKSYVVQTSTRIIERCMLMATDPGDLVLDPTCGGGTTAVVAEEWGRRWITTDTSRVALALTRTRLMSARFPYFLLADSEDGAEKEASLSGSELVQGPFRNDIRKGFVYKRVPHVSLGSIAQNPEIEVGMTQQEIDAAISRRSDSEILVDQPTADPKRVRVTGRFTVESLSPHRVLESPETTDQVDADPEAIQFETMILDNLRKAGVQNTFKDEKLAFSRLEQSALGEWIQAEGEFEEEDGTTRRVAVSIGPEFGTVGAEQVALAAQEATRGVPFDVLLVTGFAFDPHAWTKAKEINPDVAERNLGRLRVLLVRANPDLAMGDELLKKTGAGNLFMVFGEPDVDINLAGGEVTVELKGLDVYDPTTGQVRSASIADIACWFIDTNYDGTSFFVRHAYFTGGQKPYESLAKTLRAEIDDDAWASLYSTTSRAFDNPASGKIAIKVINHYGDEVMQVYEF
jgi:adenine-specific DNA-methyltransferase